MQIAIVLFLISRVLGGVFFFNIEDYGADPSGQKDSTAAIQVLIYNN